MNRKAIATILIFLLFLSACSDEKHQQPPEKVIVATPEELDAKVASFIQSSLQFAADNNGLIGDSIRLAYRSPVALIYEKNNYASVWCGKEKWNSLGDSLFGFISNARLYGLFPGDYYFPVLDSIRTRLFNDSLSQAERKDAAVWAKADMMLTDAFVHIINDLKLGRLENDSVNLRQDSVLGDEFYQQRLQLIQRNHSLALVFGSLEPKHTGYLELKAGIPAFLEKADFRTFTLVPAPVKNPGPEFKALLQKRLFEGGYIASDSIEADSLQLAEAVKKFQKGNAITADGKAGEETVRLMNTSDHDKFIRIAITLDRYKMLPDKMPSRYLWVNLPGYYMRFYEDDTLRLTSKIICGKPATRTPLLNSAISELVTYPQWTVPESIIKKEILPAIKKDPGYLAAKGFSLINGKGDEIDPYTVDWTKYKKGIPYKVVQGSGDENALGILKFNFPNKYAVYLHDTNQRYLFAQSKRSLSHGCVRVQEWEKLAYSIVRFDNKEKLQQPSPVEDSLTSWLKKKEKHSIAVKNRLPVYIRYFTCDTEDGKIVFYNDVYGEDKLLQEKYFAGK